VEGKDSRIELVVGTTEEKIKVEDNKGKGFVSNKGQACGRTMS